MTTKLTVAAAAVAALLAATFVSGSAQAISLPVLKSDVSQNDVQATEGTCVDCGASSNGLIKDIQYGTTMRELQFGLKLMF